MTLTIHVVDDEPLVLDSLRMLLRSYGYTVCLYETAEAFLDGGEPEAPCCALVDIRMPGIGGYGLLDKVTRSGWSVPVILSSGDMDPGRGAAALKRGAVDIIDKPYSENTLLEAIAAAEETAARLQSPRAKPSSS